MIFTAPTGRPISSAIVIATAVVIPWPTSARGKANETVPSRLTVMVISPRRGQRRICQQVGQVIEIDWLGGGDRGRCGLNGQLGAGDQRRAGDQIAEESSSGKSATFERIRCLAPRVVLVASDRASLYSISHWFLPADLWSRCQPAVLDGTARPVMLPRVNSARDRQRTQVTIVGAGPAGLLLAHLLHLHGVESVLLEVRSRAYCEARIRAGVLEHGTRELLLEAGVGERMEREGLVHGGIHLRFDGHSHHIPMSELTGGRCVTIYGQTEVVKDLIAARVASGAPLQFECSKLTIEGLETDAPVVRYVHNGREHELGCELVAGCDGFHGVCRAAIPAAVLRTWERVYPFAWLGILAAVAPSTDELIYARHEHGFALHSMRSSELSRLYLQVDPSDPLERWPDDRIWEELQRRLATEGWALQEGPVLEKSITPMRSFVAAPMRHGALLLAGDAAHIVPPTGAKGLNLAVADVALLAEAIAEHIGAGSPTGLDEYPDRCLRRVWRAQHFSWWMTQMLHVDPHADDYERELQRSQLQYVSSSTAAATMLAENYVGLALEQSGRRDGAL